MKHQRTEHHSYLLPFGISLSCICGAAVADPIHGRPPCEWCDDLDEPPEQDLGAPSPWWHRLWCRLVAKLYGP